MYKKIVCVLIAVCFLLIGIAAVTVAAEKPAATTAQPPATVTKPGGMPPIPMFTCPAGWHQKKKTSEEFKCAPNKPAPVKCPEGWKYVEALDCQSYPGLGTQVTCSGCEVGCLKIPVIK